MKKETVGSRIKRLRMERRLTQQDVADALHLTRQAVSNYENDRTEADYDTLRMLAHLLKTDVDYLLNINGSAHSADAAWIAPESGPGSARPVDPAEALTPARPIENIAEPQSPRRAAPCGVSVRRIVWPLLLFAVLLIGIFFGVRQMRSQASAAVEGLPDDPSGVSQSPSPLPESLRESADYPGWYYGLPGLYRMEGDTPVCVSERPVKDLLFILKPGDMGDPIILS